MLSGVIRQAGKKWFILALLAIAVGGFFLPAPGGIVDKNVPWASKAAIAVLLFCMSFTLETGEILRGLGKLKAIGFALFTTYVVLPLVFYGWVAAFYSGAGHEVKNVSVGLFILAAVPCTLASSAIWTRVSGGNDALALVISVVSNGLSFLTAPAILKLLAGAEIEVGFLWMMMELLLTVLAPILAGQVLRLWLGRFADRHRAGINAFAQAVILFMVFIAVSRAGTERSGVSAAFVAGVALSVSAIHLLAAGFIALSGRAAGIEARDLAAVVFGGSQKTLPVSLHISRTFFGGFALAILPIVMFHACQLVIDTLISDALRKRLKGAEQG